MRKPKPISMRSWNKVPRDLQFGCLFYHAVGHVPRGGDRKNYNPSAILDMQNYERWALKQDAKEAARKAKRKASK